MPARAPTLGSGANPFQVSNAAFSAFDLGAGGLTPAQQALQDAGDARYAVGLRWANGQATDSEYLAAIQTELAAATAIAQSTDPEVSGPAKKQIESLNNLVHDVNVQIGETAARAQGDSALLAFWQAQLATMNPGSTAYIRLADQIKNLADSVANQKDIDTQKAAAFAMQSAQSQWQAGNLSDAGYKQALLTYADSQKPGTTEWINAHDTYNTTVYRLDRNAIVEDVNQGKAQLEDLLKFDRAHLDKIGDKGSQAYRDALDAYQQTQGQLFAKLDKKVVDDFQAGHMTAAQAVAWYKGQLVGQFADNPGVLEQITSRVNDFNTRVQDAQDSAMVDKWNTGKVSQATFAAYAKTRQAAYAPGTADYDKWSGYLDATKDKVTQSQMTYAYGLSQKYVDLQKFIADNSKPPTGGTSTSTRTVLGPDGHWHAVSVTKATALSPSEQAAWQQRQKEVADAKNQLAALSHQIAGTPTGFVSATQMRDYYVGLQAKTVKGTPDWFAFQASIDGYNDRIHYEATLSGNGVKIGYPGITAAGVSAGGGGGGAAVAGGGKGTTVPKGSKIPMPSGATFRGGHYTSAELDYVANRIAQGTGLDPAVARLWVMKEQGFGNNPLGVSAGGDVGQHGLLAYFSTIDKGIDEAIRWVNTHGNMRGIKAAAGKSQAEQIRAIDSSPWGPGGNKGGYRGSLVSLANRQGFKAPSGAGAGAKPPDNGITQDQFLAGLAARESHGDYNARNSKTGAFGRYQILPANWKAWAGKYLKNPNAPATPANQEAVVRAKSQELYNWLGSWQAVAHWWLTGGSDANAHQDPSKWSASSAAYVRGVISGAGGTVVEAAKPGAPSKAATLPPGAAKGPPVPTTAVTTAAGKGVPSGLKAITSQTTVTPRPGATPITYTTTAPIDFPTNLDSTAFQKLYTQLVGAVNSGKTSFAYRDGSGHLVNILLPDNPAERWKLINDLDSRRVEMFQNQESQKAGTAQAGPASAATAAALKQAGQNQLNLIDMNYGGTRTVIDPATGKPVKQDRGERANPPVVNPAAQVGKTGAKGAPTKAALDEARTGNYGAVQSSGLTPLASGIRVLDQAKGYIAHQTKLMQDARDAGNMDEAYAHWLNIHDVLTDTSMFVQQIGTYSFQAVSVVGQVYAGTGATPSAGQTAELNRLKNYATELAEAAAPADTYAGTKIKPFIKVDANDKIVRDKGTGRIALGDGIIKTADPTPTGGVKIDFTKSPVAGQTTKGPVYAPPGRVQANIPDGQGGITVAYTKWHVGQVGVFKLANGEEIPIEGKVLDVGGWVEDPFNPGRWSPTVIVYQSDPRVGLKNVPITKNGKPDGEPTGKYAVEFTPLEGDIGVRTFAGGDSRAPSKTDRYRLQFDPATGTMSLIQIHTDPGTGKATIVNHGEVRGAKAKAEIDNAGIGLDTAKTGPEATKFLLGAGIAGAFPGIDFSTANTWANQGRVKGFGGQVATTAAAAANALAKGGIFGVLGTLFGGGQPTPLGNQSDMFGSRGPIRPSGPNTLGAPPVPGSGWTNIGGDMPNPYWYGPPGAQAAAPTLTPVTLTPGGGKYGPTLGAGATLAPIGVGAGVLPPIKTPGVKAPTVIPAAKPSVKVGVGAGATGPKYVPPPKAPVVKKPTTTPSPKVGVGAGATGPGNVQAVVTLPKITPPPLKAPVVKKPATKPSVSVGAGVGAR
jgi:hypothetical protein